MARDSAIAHLSEWDRFWAFVREHESGCWLWMGSTAGPGYGKFTIDNEKWYAHRIVYEWIVGVIRPGLTIDHLCRNRRCVNPAHLEAVTHRENVLRGESPSARQARQTHCRRGHPLSGDNLIRSGRRRRCRTCHYAWLQGQKEKHRAR